MSEQVLVFKRRLFPTLPNTGFTSCLEILPQILSKAEFLDRDEAESNFNYKQIIPYSILRYNGSIFRYKRSAWSSEARLHHQYSIGVGGHVNKSDDLPLFSDATSIVDWTRDRELNEEFYVEGPSEPRLIGLLNDESDEVGRVHFGIIYEYWLKGPNIEARERRVHIHHEFVPLTELLTGSNEYESWSRLIIEQYLSLHDPVAIHQWKS
jgi:predicted NUDIX family phosphoesterase